MDKRQISLIVLLIGMILLYLYGARKNYIRRIFAGIDKCPFGKTEMNVTEKLGVNSDTQGIFSTCLYGYPSSPEFIKRYIEPLYKNARKVKKMIPNWQIRIYTADTIDQKYIDDFVRLGCQVFKMSPTPKGHEGAMWRFLAAADDLPFVCIDSDDLLTQQDIDDIKNWFNSKKKFIIKTYGLIAMSAGRWGGMGRSIPDIKERLSNYCDYWYGSDESFLKKEVWPIVKENCFLTHPIKNCIVSLSIFFIIVLYIYMII